MIRLAKTTFWRNKTRLELWEEHLKDPFVALDKSPEVRGRSVLRLTVGSRLLWNRGCNDLRPDGFRSDPRSVGQAFVGRGPMAFSGCMGQCASAQPPRSGTSQRGYGPHGELFFFLLKREPRVLGELVRFGPSISVALLCRQVARVKATWLMTCCISSGYSDPATQFPSSFKTGKWRRWQRAATSPWTCCVRKCM